MSRQVNCSTFEISNASAFVNHAVQLGWRLAVVAGLLTPSGVWAEEATADADPASVAAQDVAAQQDASGDNAGDSVDSATVLPPRESKFSEDSVLVATRPASEAAASDLPPAETSLKPVSRYPQQQPVLAEPPREGSAPAANKPAASILKETTLAAQSAEVKPAAVEPNASPAPPVDITPIAAAPIATQTEAVATDAADNNQEQIEPAKLADATAAAPSAEPAVVTDAKTETPSSDTPNSDAPRVASRTPAKADATDVAQAYADNAQLEPARFHGIVPGVSTGDELTNAWGPAKETSPTETGRVLSYDMPPFAAVDVLVEDEVVALIKVELESQQQPERLARRLRMNKIEAVEILNESGASTVGLAYPEKGMLLLLSTLPESAPPSAPQFVTHMVIQPLDAEAFALRADQAPYSAFEKKLADLEQAIQLDADNAYANWQLAELYRLSRKPDQALKAAAAALRAAPKNDAYRLSMAECLTEQGEYDQAVLESRKVLDSDGAPSVVKAGALHLMGRLASLGDSNIAEKAIGFHTMAIDVADKLATSNDRKERFAAKRVLVDSHLAVAREISRRKYARKTEIVAQWIGRASGLAEQMIADDGGSIELRLIVARESLAALANLNPTKDPQPWIKEAEETASQLLADTRDPVFRSRVEWQLGEAYFHALRIEHGRKRVEAGVAYGKKSIERMLAGAVGAEAQPAAEMLVGRLYFHMGAIFAVHEQDHAKAITWYSKAQPLLVGGREVSELAVPRRQGEALVSMAVSYWDQGQREKAVDLTVTGAQLMERAVAGGVLDETALAVPYGNLATMQKKLGNRNESAKYAKLARGARGSAVAQAPPAVRPQVEQASKPQRRNTTAPSQASRQRTQKQASRPQGRFSANGSQANRSQTSRSQANSRARSSASSKPSQQPGGTRTASRPKNNSQARNSKPSNSRASNSSASSSKRNASQPAATKARASSSGKPSRLRRTTSRNFLR